MSTKYDGLQVRTFSADFQEPGVIYWFFDYSGANVGWETIRLRLLKDEEYIQMYEGAEGLFLDEETTMDVLTP